MSNAPEEMGAFEKDALYRMLVEAARYWVIENYLRTGELPKERTNFVYADGPKAIDWGNPPGRNPPEGTAVLRYKRIVVRLSIEDYGVAPTPVIPKAEDT